MLKAQSKANFVNAGKRGNWPRHASSGYKYRAQRARIYNTRQERPEKLVCSPRIA